MFGNIYREKKILITGNTGFKGAWLTNWLLNLGAKVIGFSNEIPTKPSMFKILSLPSKIKYVTGDICDYTLLNKVISEEKPDFIFHLAAQSIVSKSYSSPLETVLSNVKGTTNLLEVLRISNHKCSVVVITSDKVYQNIEQIWGYKENDKIGGNDVYSASKGAAELIVNSYYHSFFKYEKSKVRLAVGRAGNVIGGGDWTKDRVVVDAVLAWSNKKKVNIRNPESTRPWQHVLEPLSGYLNLGSKLSKNKNLNGEAFNFGPQAEQNRNVRELLFDLSKYWKFYDFKKVFKISDKKIFNEASLLKLNCDKSLIKLNWKPVFNYEETIKFTSEWYYNFYNNRKKIQEFTHNQIIEYENIAKSRLASWTE